MSKTLGVLGGLGPAASVYFYRLLTEHTAAVCDQEHLNIVLISNAEIPDRSEYIMGKSDRSPLPAMQQSVARLVAAGAEIIAIPCNTAHYFFNEIARTSPVPVLNIVRETVAAAAKHGVRRLGILATSGTVLAGAYPQAAKEHGIECIMPDVEEQRALMSLIYGSIKTAGTPDLDGFYRIADTLLQGGCDAIVLGCTELSLIPKDARYEQYPFIDSLLVLAARAITACEKKPTGFSEIYL